MTISFIVVGWRRQHLHRPRLGLRECVWRQESCRPVSRRLPALRRRGQTVRGHGVAAQLWQDAGLLGERLPTLRSQPNQALEILARRQRDEAIGESAEVHVLRQRGFRALRQRH